MARKKNRGDRSTSSAPDHKKIAENEKGATADDISDAESDSEAGADHDTAEAAVSAEDTGDAGSGSADTVVKENEEIKQAETIARLAEENNELKDQLLRKQADFENFRKRLLREKEEAAGLVNPETKVRDIPPQLIDHDLPGFLSLGLPLFRGPVGKRGKKKPLTPDEFVCTPHNRIDL